MNLGSDGVIGKLSPGATTSVPFAALPNGGIGSGARFDRAGRLYVADFKSHKVHVFEPGQTVPGVYFEAREEDPPGKFNQPNDLTMAADGTIYASDPKRSDGTGRIWRITRGADGKVRGELLTFGSQPMGVTNGIELSPDEATLYVGESRTSSKPARLLAYRLQDGKLVERRTVRSRRHADRYRWQTFRGATRCGHGGGIRSRWNSLAGNPLAKKGVQPIWPSAAPTEKLCSSRKARVSTGSSRRSASTGLGASSVCCDRQAPANAPRSRAMPPAR
jgi:hypothetical protein